MKIKNIIILLLMLTTQICFGQHKWIEGGVQKTISLATGAIATESMAIDKLDTVTVQSIAATGNILKWQSTVIADPLSNATYTLPAITRVGQRITINRTANNGSIISLQAAAGQTLVLANNGSELNATNGAITLESFSLTEARQVSNIGTTPVVLTYARVNAFNNLTNTLFTNAANGIKIPFGNVVYSNGMSFSGTDGIVPSASGRYRVSWLMTATSAEFAGDGFIHVVQNGTSVGQVFYNMMEAAGVNQSTGFIDVDLVAGQTVNLHYRSSVVAGDNIIWEVGSYFDIVQLGGHLPITGVAAGDNVMTGLVSGQTVGAVGTPLALIAKTGQGVSVASNGVVLNGGSGGKTFKMLGSIARMNGTGGSSEIAYQFRNVTANAYIGNEGTVTQNTALGAGSTAFGEVSVAANQSVTIQLWVTKNTSAGTLTTNGVGGGGAGTFYIYQDGYSATTDYGGWLTNSTAIYPSSITKKVGIGTQSPLVPLHVEGTAGATTISTQPNIAKFAALNLNNTLDVSAQLASPFGMSIQARDENVNVPVPLLLQKDGGNVGIGTVTPNANLQVAGSVAFGTTTTTAAAYTITANDYNVFLTLAGAQTITLPTVTAATAGRILNIANPTNTAKTISSFTDAGGVVFTAIPINTSVTLISDGTVWRNVTALANKARVRAHTGNAVAFGAGAGTTITTWTETEDATNSFDGATGVFTAPRAGYYDVDFQYMVQTATVAINNRLGIICSINNSAFGVNNPIHSFHAAVASPTNFFIRGSEKKFLTAGQTLRLNAFLDGATAATGTGNANFNYFHITEL